MVKYRGKRKEFRIYVEGGGSSSDTRAAFRRGWSAFLQDLVDEARKRSIKWQVIACGGRGDAFNNFCKALRTHPDAFNVLLIDSEGSVGESDTSPWDYLQQHDRWKRPSDTTDDQCFLMVQSMEAWIIADREALADYYGQGFNPGSLPGGNVEHVEPQRLVDALNQAVRETSKRTYRKMPHGPDLLARVQIAAVRTAASHCERLLSMLLRKMGE